MAERRVCKSDPDFERLFALANDLAIVTNPQRWYNLTGDYMDMAEPERLAVVAEIKNMMAEALAEKPLSETAFAAAIEGLDLTGLGGE